MGQFVKLINYDRMMRYTSVGTNGTENHWVDLGGTTRGYGSYGYSTAPFYGGAFGGTYTDQTALNNCPLFPHPSSDNNISYDSTSISNEIASTTSISFTRLPDNTGWVANIIIKGTSGNDETVRSLLFTKWINYNSSNYAAGLLFAYILDTPIELNAENDYTANITMSVKFE